MDLDALAREIVALFAESQFHSPKEAESAVRSLLNRLELPPTPQQLGRIGGLKGGKATGDAKRRGNSDYYRSLAARRGQKAPF